MVTVVVVINTLISLALLYIAWRVWKLKQRLGRIADRLTAYERRSHAVLSKVPENIYTSEQNIYTLQQKNQAFQMQIQQVRQILSLLLLGRQIWQRYFGKKTAIK
ncbi:hypothetical protein [Calothrix sp. PCC 7507]|uniref:hypothetical protein n=1 Tax=Calothrix sp. PCC 7507 TaxID=99598 RepID=UPI00029F2267|nr:hypothetical protein [Calothrix sp. PCC 7507]AFY32920.1 hypothetical protein Cal7507_2491 [Calothrix sp. PCC 7507]